MTRVPDPIAEPPDPPAPPPMGMPEPQSQPGVGSQIGRFNVDQVIGQLSRNIENWSIQAEHFKEWLDTVTAEDLQKPPFNYDEESVAVLKSATADLDALAEVYHGQLAVPQARDFGVFARRTAGLNLPGLTA